MPKWLYFTLTGVGAAAAASALTYYIPRRRLAKRWTLRAPLASKDFTVEKCLGSGAQGACYLIRNHERGGRREVVKVSPKGAAQAAVDRLQALRATLEAYPAAPSVQWIPLLGAEMIHHEGKDHVLQYLAHVPGPNLWQAKRRGRLATVPGCFVAEWARDILEQWRWQESVGLALTNLVHRNYIVGMDARLWRHDYDAVRDDMSEPRLWRGRYRAIRMAHELLAELAGRRPSRKAPLSPREESLREQAGNLMVELDLGRRMLRKMETRMGHGERRALFERLAPVFPEWLERVRELAAVWPSTELRRLDPEGVMRHYLPAWA